MCGVPPPREGPAEAGRAGNTHGRLPHGKACRTFARPSHCRAGSVSQRASAGAAPGFAEQQKGWLGNLSARSLGGLTKPCVRLYTNGIMYLGDNRLTFWWRRFQTFGKR